MNLELELTRSLIGRKAKDIDFAVSRELAEDDFAKLNDERGVQKPLPLAKRLSQRHRALAQYISLGYTDGECAALLGYSPSRISILKSDPAFINLLAIYLSEQQGRYETVEKKAVGVLEETLDQIADQLENEPEISMGTKLEIVKTIGDRVGFAPQQKPSGDANINITIAAQMEAGRARVERMRQAEPIDITPIEDKS
jgi:hypothetical protein